MQIVHGLPEAFRAQAAGLYWQAFGAKLGLVMGPRARALRYLQRVMQLDQCFAALQGGTLVGIVGYAGPKTSFAGGAADDLRAVYGRWGARWRLPLLLRVGLDAAPHGALMIDGFSVAPQWQNGGIGTLLLAQLTDFARRNGYGHLHLDVASSNARARAFYQRRGFGQINARALGPLRMVFGFTHVLRMGRDL